jgi:hypothetical protein
MFPSFTKWRKGRRLAREAQLERNGFDYAAGALLRKEETPISLEAQWWHNTNSGAFDRGVMRATYTLIDLKVVEDDSL